MKRILIMLMMLLSVVTLRAQNSIDRLIDQYSAVGGFTFTSVVKRDSQTRKVVKVVKQLSFTNHPATNFKRAFEAEKPSGKLIKRVVNYDEEWTLVIKKSGRQTIYTLRFPKDSFNWGGKIMVIINVI